MTLSSDEQFDPDDGLIDAIITFTGCIGNALEDVCSYGWTIGESYVPFDEDEENEDPDDPCDVACTQAWVRVMSITPSSVDPTSMDGNDCAMMLNLQLEVGILRCIELRQGGEAPTATEVLGYAIQSVNDSRAILRAAMNCEVWDSITAGEWLPQGPLGGQYGGTWTFTVTVDSGVDC